MTDSVITNQDTPSNEPTEAPPKSSLPFYPFHLPDPILRDPPQRITKLSILKKQRNRKRIFTEENSNQEHECKKVLFKRSTAI